MKQDQSVNAAKRMTADPVTCGHRFSYKEISQTGVKFDEFLWQQQGILIFHKEGDRFIHSFCDGALLCRMGLKPERVIGRDVREFLPDAMAKETIRYYERAWQGEDVILEGLSPDGIQFRATLKPIKRNGQVYEVVALWGEVNRCQWADWEQEDEQLPEQSPPDEDVDFVLVCSFDVLGNLTYANNAFYRLIGYGPEEVERRLLASLIDDEDRKKASRTFRRARKGIRQSGVFAIRDRCGRRIELHVTQLPIKVDDLIIGVCVIAIDMRMQKCREEELWLAKEQLESLLEHASDPIAILDPNCRVIRMNKAAQTILGISNSKAVGMYIGDGWGDSCDELVRLIQEVKDGRRIVDYETIKQRPDGSKANISLTLAPVCNIDGDVVAITCIARDLTENKRAKESLRESEAQLRTLINAMPDFICLKDGEGRWLEANDYALRLFQLEGVDYRGKNGLELSEYSEMLKGILEASQSSDEKAWARGESVREEQTVWRTDGSPLTFDVCKVPIYDSSGKRQALVVIGRNITERKQTEELLLQSDKLSAVGELAAGVAHEIRNPLTALKGFIQLLRSDDDSKRHYFDIMGSELDRINFIVGELLLLAKPQAATFQQKNVIGLLKNVISLLETQAIMKNIEIRTSCAMESLFIMCEENQLKQVFINILKNAIEAMPPCGGEIMIRVQLQEPDKVLISFVDQGGGIPEERLSRLGNPFYTTKENGTGLGLMVSYKIIHDHQGSITFSSKVGEGTKVDVLLPITLKGKEADSCSDHISGISNN
ncbi:MAG: PAS domain S-box protein [Brevibacillus sp.]|nr:PAS domain S-box protein [Brevibacillus sp.]